MASVSSPAFYLLTKEYPTGGNIFSYLWHKLFRKTKEIEVPMVDPIETMLSVLSVAAHTPFDKKIVKAIAAEDDVYGEYPKLLVNYSIVSREQIIPFLREAFPLDRALSESDARLASQIEELCITKLHAATQYGYCYSADAQSFRIFSTLGSPVTTLATERKRVEYADFLQKMLNIRSEAEAQGVAQTVHDVLVARLCNRAFFFAEEDKEKHQIKLPFVDIVVYAYLKEELNLTPDTMAAQSLKSEEKYAPLRAFVKAFDEALDKHAFCVDFVELTTRELNKVGEKYAAKPEISTAFSDVMGSQIKTEDEQKALNIRRVTAAATVVSFLAFLNLTEKK